MDDGQSQVDLVEVFEHDTDDDDDSMIILTPADSDLESDDYEQVKSMNHSQPRSDGPSEKEMYGMFQVNSNGTCTRHRKSALPCSRRVLSQGSSRRYVEPSHHSNLEDAIVARRCNGGLGQRNMHYIEYAWDLSDAETKTIEIQWRLPTGTCLDASHLRIDCQRYVPQDADTNTQSMTFQIQGTEVTIPLPPFATQNTSVLEDSMARFLSANMADVLRDIYAATHDRLARSTLREAMRYCATYSSEMLHLALLIRCASFCSQGRGVIIGSEALGIGVHDFTSRLGAEAMSSYPVWNHGVDRPVPLSLDHQMDVAIKNIITKLQSRVLRLVQARICKSRARSEDWYEIYLTVYVLLSNLEYVHRGSHGYLQSQMQSQHAQCINGIMISHIEELDVSAENILHHFRSVLGGTVPFTLLEGKAGELQARADIDEIAMTYLRSLGDTAPAFDGTPSADSLRLKSMFPNLPRAPDGRWIAGLYTGLRI